MRVFQSDIREERICILFPLCDVESGSSSFSYIKEGVVEFQRESKRIIFRHVIYQKTSSLLHELHRNSDQNFFLL